LQYPHLMALGDVVPSIIRLVIASARGRPLFNSDLPAERSGEPHELAGLDISMFLTSSDHVQGYSTVSDMEGLCDMLFAII